MFKSLTNLLRNAFVAGFCLAGLAASAQSGMPQVIATGGATNDAICCTIGQTFAGDNLGMWDAAAVIGAGIDGVFISEGDVVVENVSADHALKVLLSEEALAAGASYNIYSVSGMLLDSGKINATPYTISYGHLLSSGQYVVVTVATAKSGVLTTVKVTL